MACEDIGTKEQVARLKRARRKAGIYHHKFDYHFNKCMDRLSWGQKQYLPDEGLLQLEELLMQVPRLTPDAKAWKHAQIAMDSMRKWESYAAEASYWSGLILMEFQTPLPNKNPHGLRLIPGGRY